jgi:formate hydrogenlyase subunit 3/multisubunit Na+/H+ antiporter MnhD subunit
MSTNFASHNLPGFFLFPLFVAALLFLIPRAQKRGGSGALLALMATSGNLLAALAAFFAKGSAGYFSVPWLGSQVEFSLRLYSFSAFIILATAVFGFLVALFSAKSLEGKPYARQFYAYLLITLAFVNGAVLADNLLVLLFFWEGLLVTIFAMIAAGGGKGAFKTAVKALVIIGVTDLCMMLGIALTGHLAGTLTISKISLPLSAAGSIAFILLMIGALGKAGSMPFHSWIPDAALDSPLPFMAIMPAALEKLLGIYFLARISLDMFRLAPGCAISTLMMIIGGATILLAVMMALIQKDYKKLLAYHAISQVGYMILGIGTMVPAGIVGGLFHMVNNALYKSGLFLTGGAVEKQAGTTDLRKLGGIGTKMPVTCACFLVMAASISGVPPFNGFFSKELVYDAALERHWLFYALAVAGSFFTAASFLKLGHAAYFGKRSREHDHVKEAPVPMLVPMIVLACACIIFGVFNSLPLNHLIQPAVGAQRLEGRSFAGFPQNMLLVAVTAAVLIAALLNHLLGAKAKGAGIKAVDHIHHAPGLRQIYDTAEKGWLDPYTIGSIVTGGGAKILWYIDRGVDWLYDSAAVTTVRFFTSVVKKAQAGNYQGYLLWSLAGMVLVAWFLMRFVTGG